MMSESKVREPTTEFSQRCYDVRIRWEKGEISFSDAVSSLNSYNQEAVNAGNLANQAMVEYQLGYISHYHGNLDASIYHYQRSYDLFQRVDNCEFLARLTLNLGEEYRYKGDFHKAIELYDDALDSAKGRGNIELQAYATLNRGWALFNIDKFEEARETFLAAEKLCISLNGYWQQDSLLCELYYIMAINCIKLGERDKVWGYTKKAIEASIRDGRPRSHGYANCLLGEIASEAEPIPDSDIQRDPDYYFQKSLDAFQKIDAFAEMARTTFLQACSLAKRGEIVAATHKFQKAMLNFHRLGMIHDAALAAEAQLKLG